MKKFLLIFFSIISVLLLVACGASPDQSNAEDDKTVIDEPVVDEVKFADDEVVNAFNKAYNEISESDFTDISKGNIRTKYFASSYGYYCELLDANDTGKISITINETNETAELGTAGMDKVFFYTAKCIDSSLSDDDINNFFQSMVNSSAGIDFELGSMKISYFRDCELSNGHNRGHIEINAQ